MSIGFTKSVRSSTITQPMIPLTTNLGLIHTQYFCTQYWDKKTFFTQYFFPVWIEKKISVYLTRFWNLTTIFWQKNVFLFFIAIAFNRNIAIL